MTDIARRTVLVGGVAFAAAMALPLPKLRSPATAYSAKRFYDSVGLCTHPNWRDTIWGRTDWESAFLQTGVKNLRGKIGRSYAGRAAAADLQPLFAAGAKICVPVPEYDGSDFDLAATKASLDFLAESVGAENISGIESANEYNSPRSSPADWALRLRRFQAWLHDTVRGNHAFDRVPLIAPSIWGRLTPDYHELGSLLPNVDRGCIHFYTGGRRPSRFGFSSEYAEIGGFGDSTLKEALADASTLAPGRPIWMTEFGYRVAGPGASTRGDVPENVATKYLLRGLFDIFAQGVEKTFIYTLLDDVHRKPPRYHGLMDGSLNPRRSFHALSNLMSLFRDDGGSPAAEPLHYRLAGATTALKQHLFRRSDGSFLVILYQDVDSYDRMTKRELDIPPQEVKMAFDQPAGTLELFDPGISPEPFRTARNASSVSLPVRDAVLAVKVTPDRSPQA